MTSPTTISVLVPMLGRSEAVRPLVENILRVSKVPTQVVFICSPDDQDVINACHSVLARTIIAPYPAQPGDYSRKINLAYRETDAPWLLLGASDLLFHPGWDVQALATAEESGCSVIGTNDLGNPTVIAGKHSTHPLVARSYIAERGGTLDLEPGVVYCELYGHQNCDTELVVLAKARKTFAFAQQSHVEHLHPFWKKAATDDTYKRGQQTSRADAVLHVKRLRMLRRIDP